MKTLSAGFLLISPQGILLAHATGTARWDIPKGRLDEGETPLIAAVRETMEETGIDVSRRQHEALDLGQRSYLKTKNLHLFRLDFSEALDLSSCQCSTFFEVQKGVTLTGEPRIRRVPETDNWKWVPLDLVHKYVGRGLLDTLTDVGLFKPQASKTITF